MAEFTGKTVLISGAARGQGRAHAQRFAAEGASLVLFDICAQIPGVPFPMATTEDLKETVRLVESRGAKAVAGVADVRSFQQVDAIAQQGLDAFGHIDIVIANSGIVSTPAKVWEIDPADFQSVVDVDLVGVWHTMRASLPSMVEQERGGCVVVTASGAAVKGTANISPYVAAKHGLIGLVMTAARELGPHRIRVNAVLPGNTNTMMFRNEATMRLFTPDLDEPEEDKFLQRAASRTPMGIPYVEPSDISEAIVFLASSRARYITGTSMLVDGGSAIP